MGWKSSSNTNSMDKMGVSKGKPLTSHHHPVQAPSVSSEFLYKERFLFVKG